MQIKSLKIENFRNIEKEKIEFYPGVNLLYGQNAQGKTNILEAIYYFARGKSFRSASDSELKRFGEDGFYIELDYEKEGKKQNLSYKKWSEESGVSVDTIDRIIHPENPEKDSPRVNTLESLCKVLGVELWELFYTGNKSLVVLQAEIHSLKAERDALLEENGALKNQVDTLSAKVDSLRDKNDALKDQLIETHNYYIKQKISE